MTAPDPRSRWAGLSPAERRQKRKAQLIDAGLELLRTGDIADVTVRATARQAGMHRRYFLENFSGRDELIAAMFTQEYLALVTFLLPSLQMPGEPTDSVWLIQVIRAVLEYTLDGPSRAKILFISGADEQILREMREDLAAVVVNVVAGAQMHDDSSTRNKVVASMVSGAAMEFMVRWCRGEYGSDLDTVATIGGEIMFTMIQSVNSVEGLSARAVHEVGRATGTLPRARQS